MREREGRSRSWASGVRETEMAIKKTHFRKRDTHKIPSRILALWMFISRSFIWEAHHFFLVVTLLSHVSLLSSCLNFLRAAGANQVILNNFHSLHSLLICCINHRYVAADASSARA